MYVTLDEAKAHLRVDFDDDDVMIQDLIDMAEEYLQRQYSLVFIDLVVEYGGKLPLTLKQSIKLLVTDYYENRSIVNITNSSRYTPTIVPALERVMNIWNLSMV